VLKETEELHVNNIIKKINDKFLLQIEEKNATLVLELKAEKDLVKGHPIHFMNMFSNLIDNALKYSKEDVPPQICIRTKNIKNRIVVSIEDNGIGMSKETQSHVFDKFYRAHTGDIHNVKGFGLGLNYTRKMVEAHDGTISVDSKVGYGSTFTVNLPIV
jgi:two-component system phosphate regulon sensor histidine kinase PhoR